MASTRIASATYTEQQFQGSSTPTRTSTSSPQWDNRNRGFIPPIQLNQLRQASPVSQHDFPSIHNDQDQDRPQSHPPPGAGPQMMSSDNQQRRPPLTTQNSAGHSRTSSFFSFGKKSHSNSNSQSQSNNNTPVVDIQSQNGQGNGYGAPSTPQGPQQYPQQQQQPQTQQSSPVPSNQVVAPGPPPLHPEIRSVVQLTIAHAHKIYFSGPMVRKIERLPDGQKPAKDEGWVNVWAQLGGTTLSIWDMKQIEEASKQGKEVPPTYVNITDAVSFHCSFSLCILSHVFAVRTSIRISDSPCDGT